MACIITWNKEKWSEENMQELMDRFAMGETVQQTWKCGAHRKFGFGDRVYLSRIGQSFPGLLGSGRIVSTEAREEPDFEDPTKNAWHVDVEFDFLAKSPTSVVINHEDLAARLGIDKKTFTPQKSGSPFAGDDAQLEKIWFQLIGRAELRYADEVSLPEQFITEGAVKKVMVNRYERDPTARQKCLDTHGSSCKVCGMNFGLVYGPLGRNYIHVHHLIPLKNIGREYVVDPARDLVPLCPNCHAMIHQSDPPLTIEALKGRLLPRYLDLFR